MKIEDLNTHQINTWCPGCANNGILLAVKKAIVGLHNEGKIRTKNVVAVGGIGCGAKIYDYLQVNGFCTLHGRVLPTSLGIKTGNPRLTVIGFAGDGGTYAEGIGHLVQIARYNPNMTMIVANNQVFALTTGQATPTTEKGFIDHSLPMGVKESPLNPLALTLASGGTFVARGFALDPSHLEDLIREAVKHNGFSLVEVLQPCLNFHQQTEYLRQHIYKFYLEKRDDFSQAWEKALEWDYNLEEKAKIPLGIFYQKSQLTWEEKWPQLNFPWYQKERKVDWTQVIENWKWKKKEK
jgi:2-oxoglutarate/2-oxoacid ferredoxin oxidoreductase subunit beta